MVISSPALTSALMTTPRKIYSLDLQGANSVQLCSLQGSVLRTPASLVSPDQPSHPTLQLSNPLGCTWVSPLSLLWPGAVNWGNDRTCFLFGDRYVLSLMPSVLKTLFTYCLFFGWLFLVFGFIKQEGNIQSLILYLVQKTKLSLTF